MTTTTDTDYGKLKRGFKNQLLKALRTPPDEGGYYQAQETLMYPGEVKREDSDSFCCLGVMCDLLVLNGKADWEKKYQSWVIFDNGKNEIEWEDEQVESLLHELAIIPKELAEKIGLSAVAIHHLIGMNDKGISFNRIADWIEENL